MPTCIFCDIIAGDRPAEVVFESDDTIGFLDHRPLFPGHVLLLPRQHCTTLPDLPADRVGDLFTQVQHLCRAVQSAMDAQGTFVAINNKVSQSVPHLHVHVIPRRRGMALEASSGPGSGIGDGDHIREVQGAIRELWAALSDASAARQEAISGRCLRCL